MSEIVALSGSVIKTESKDPRKNRSDADGPIRLSKWMLRFRKQSAPPETPKPTGFGDEIREGLERNAWRSIIELVPKDSDKISRWFKEVRGYKDKLNNLLDSDKIGDRWTGLTLLGYIAQVDRRDVQEWLCEFTGERIPLLEQEYASHIDDDFTPIQPLHLLTTLAIYGGNEEKSKSRAFLESQRKILAKGLADPGYQHYYIEGLGRLLAHGINIFEKDGKTVDMIYQSLPVDEQPGMIADFLNRPRGSEERVKGTEWVKQFLAQYGLNGNEFLHAWRMGSQGGKKQRIKADLERIVSLEEEEAGSTRVLTNEFGIHYYYRYPESMLLRQYRERNRTDLPYGVVINSYSDYNGFLGNNVEVYSNLSFINIYNYAVRFMEASNPDDIRMRLADVNSRYGNEHKISFAMLGGHGSRSGIQFGEGIRSSKLRVADLKGNEGILNQAGQFFEENPTIILNSCSTGRRRLFFRDSMGEIISKALGATVFAPARPGSISSLDVRVVDGKLVFDVKFTRLINKKFEDITRVFRPR